MNDINMCLKITYTDKLYDFGKWSGRMDANADLSRMYNEVPGTCLMLLFQNLF
jgi:hypothetical protein